MPVAPAEGHLVLELYPFHESISKTSAERTYGKKYTYRPILIESLAGIGDLKTRW